MNDYSIEQAAERIVDPKTRNHFDEVYACYVAGHYRSAVVMLWSVAITDIFFKLEHMKSAYQEPVATAILSKIDKSKKENPNSGEWESMLIKEVESQTKLLDNADLTLLESLQKQRNLSAHPVLTEQEALFSPNKETVRAHIRNILDSVLTKPPFMSRKAFDAFTEDVERFGQLNLDTDRLKELLEERYFKHFSPATYIHVFKSLWRVTFKSKDSQPKANRTVNRQALEILFSHRKTEALSKINSERDWFSDVSFDDDYLIEMTTFFRSNPETYPLMTDALKGVVAGYAERNINNFALCWFTSDSLDNYIQTISERISGGESLDEDAYLYFCQSLRTTGCFSRVLDIGIISYVGSGTYDTATLRFNKMVRPFLNEYSMDQFVTLLYKIELNGQTYERRGVQRDHSEVKERIDEIDIDSAFDFTAYPKFKKSIRL